MTEWITSAPKRNDPEAQMQMAVWQHIVLRKPKNVIAFAVPNGEKRSKRTAGRLKAQGVVAGVADLAFVLSDGRAAFMELKSQTGRLSPAQKNFQTTCEEIGVDYAVASSLDMALKILEAWGVIKGDGNGRG